MRTADPLFVEDWITLDASMARLEKFLSLRTRKVILFGYRINDGVAVLFGESIRPRRVCIGCVVHGVHHVGSPH